MTRLNDERIAEIEAKLASYGFKDHLGHPLSNCQDFQDLLSEVKALRVEKAQAEAERDVLARVHADCGVCPLCGKLTVEQYDPNTDLWLGVSCTSCSWSIKYARPLTTSMYYAQQQAEKEGE